jgi:hypothetical protein
MLPLFFFKQAVERRSFLRRFYLAVARQLLLIIPTIFTFVERLKTE